MSDAPAVTLRRLAREDLPMTLAWRNREENRRWFKTAAPVTVEQHSGWFERNGARDDDVVFVAERALDHAPVGQVSIYRIDSATRSAEVGRFIAAPEFKRQGYMRAACGLLIDYGFRQRALDTLRLEVFEDNCDALALYAALGFISDGIESGLIQMILRRS